MSDQPVIKDEKSNTEISGLISVSSQCDSVSQSVNKEAIKKCDENNDSENSECDSNLSSSNSVVNLETVNEVTSFGPCNLTISENLPPCSDDYEPSAKKLKVANESLINEICNENEIGTTNLVKNNCNRSIATDSNITDKDKNSKEGCSSETKVICEENISEADDLDEPYLCDDNKIDFVSKIPFFHGGTNHRTKSTLKRKAEDDAPNESKSKRKKTIQFDKVTVFYFPRSQGFSCVPSQGGSTLGMSRKHFTIKSYTLSEHATEQRKAHKDYLLKLRLRKSNQEKKDIVSAYSSSEESEENSEGASDISDSDLEADSFFFLQPLPIRQRRALLRQSGIRQIEGLEKDECKDIRLSREMCGCQCKVYCDPNTCQCYEAGIKCQVDRHSFPCGCTRDGCRNANGRIEFNPIRVRTHFLHTLMRLEIEKRQATNLHQWSDFRKKDGSSVSSRLSSSWASNGIQLFDSNLSLGSCSESAASCSNVLGPPPLYSPFDHSQLGNSLSNVPVFQRVNGLPNFPVIPRVNDNCGGNYNTNGCFVFSDGVMSTFESTLIPTYGGPTVPHFPSQSTFFRSKMPVSFNLSSFPTYSTAAAAAAVVATTSNCAVYGSTSDETTILAPTTTVEKSSLDSRSSSPGFSCYEGASSSTKNSSIFNLGDMFSDFTDACSFAASSSSTALDGDRGKLSNDVAKKKESLAGGSAKHPPEPLLSSLYSIPRPSSSSSSSTSSSPPISFPFTSKLGSCELTANPLSLSHSDNESNSEEPLRTVGNRESTKEDLEDEKSKEVATVDAATRLVCPASVMEEELTTKKSMDEMNSLPSEKLPCEPMSPESSDILKYERKRVVVNGSTETALRDPQICNVAAQSYQEDAQNAFDDKNLPESVSA